MVKTKNVKIIVLCKNQLWPFFSNFEFFSKKYVYIYRERGREKEIFYHFITQNLGLVWYLFSSQLLLFFSSPISIVRVLEWWVVNYMSSTLRPLSRELALTVCCRLLKKRTDSWLQANLGRKRIKNSLLLPTFHLSIYRRRK